MTTRKSGQKKYFPNTHTHTHKKRLAGLLKTVEWHRTNERTGPFPIQIWADRIASRRLIPSTADLINARGGLTNRRRLVFDVPRTHPIRIRNRIGPFRIQFTPPPPFPPPNALAGTSYRRCCSRKNSNYSDISIYNEASQVGMEMPTERPLPSSLDIPFIRLLFVAVAFVSSSIGCNGQIR